MGDGRKGRDGVIPIELPFFSGGAEGSGVAASFWSVGSGCLMLSSSFSSAMATESFLSCGYRVFGIKVCVAAAKVEEVGWRAGEQQNDALPCDSGKKERGERV